MLVRDLVAYLLTVPQHLPVAYSLYSENVLLEVEQLSVEKLGIPRPDGWVANYRSDKPSQTYLLFPGN